jgi:heparinase II/III-like protein/alginate lyase
VVSAEQLAERRRAIAASPDLQRLLAHLRDRAAPLLERMPTVPAVKALLSVDGGVCPKDGSALTFDPWSPDEHRCPTCGASFRGERHHRTWARFQHLWLVERAAHLAALHALDGGDAAAARAREILGAYARRYWTYPNRDNVLGPSRLFFSTYLESIWILNYLAAAMLLREAGALGEADRAGVSRLADEAATMIGEFDERFSNRQTWNNAALTAIAVWFEDEDLARAAIEGPTGLVAHLRGFRRDGLWYEGENYHLFALRGLLTGAGWARWAGVDLFGDPDLAARVHAALLAPARSALPDLTYPARKDARFGVSLAQPAHVELWEIGLGRLGTGDGGQGTDELASWLSTLYRAPATRPEVFESYLHDAPLDGEAAPRLPSRVSLSWWSLLEMTPRLPHDVEPWRPASVLMPSQGLAVLREGGDDRYASLECGDTGGGHGHPDRLNLQLHAGGVYWLPDVGTGSYVSRDLFWYRSTLAHNAPRLDGTSQPLRDATCAAFDTQQGWGWARAVWPAGSVTRALVAGPEYLLDVVDLAGSEDHVLELPWHLAGRGDVTTPGAWEDGDVQGGDGFVDRARRFVPRSSGPLVIEHAEGGARLTAHLVFDGQLLRAEAPGRPGTGSREPFYVARVRGRNLRLVAVLEPWREAARVRGVRVAGDVIEVETAAGTDRHRDQGRTWEIERAGETVQLAGARPPEEPFAPIIEIDRPLPTQGVAVRLDDPPALDGTLDGFDTGEPLHLDVEDQYRRSEEGYSPEDISAVAYVNWDDAALYAAVEVAKPELCLRAPGAPPLLLDNEPDDIHSDGVQVYIGGDGGPGTGEGYTGYLVVPEEGGRLRVRTVSDAGGDPAGVRGVWRRTDTGYRVTLALAWPEGVLRHAGAQLRFDLLVNEMAPGRERRAGQLVWSGGNGWVWLCGDRQDPRRLGVLDLVG